MTSRIYTVHARINAWLRSSPLAWNEELLVGAGNASTAAAAGKCGESNPLTSVTWATSTPGTIPVGEALEAALQAVAYGAGTAKALETALTGWP